MDSFITALRLPLGVIASIIVIVFWMILLPIEFLIVLIAFPFAAILLSRFELKESLLWTFPNTVKWMRQNLSDIRFWVYDY